MRILVIGSKQYSNYKFIEDTLSDTNFDELISGGEQGADACAVVYAQSKEIFVATFRTRHPFNIRFPISKCDKVLIFWNDKKKELDELIELIEKLHIDYKICEKKKLKKSGSVLETIF